MGPETSTQVVSDVLTVPNLLSVLRLVLVPVFLVLVVRREDGWAVVTLVVSGVTDFLDGALARRWHQVSRLGQVLDPVADRLFILTTVLGLALRGAIPWWLLLVIVLRDALLSLTIPVLAAHDYGPLPVHYLGKAATLNLLFSFPLLLLGAGDGAVAAVARPVGWAFAGWGVALYWWAAWLYFKQVRELVAPARARGV